MNPCGKGERNQHPVTDAGLPSSFHQLKACHTEQNSSGEKPVKIKRRRTRRERNDVKFGKNGTDGVLERRPSCRGLQKMLPPFWSSQLTNCAKPASFKGIGGAKPVIITQNRLSQHLGMFNKEVKSVDIERLLKPGCEQVFLEATPLRRDSGVDTQVGDESQTGKSVCSDQTSVPCEQLRSSVNNLCGMNEDSLPIVVPTVPVAVTEHCSTAPVNATDPGTQSSSAPPAKEMNDQSELQTAEADRCRSNALVVANEKENIPPTSPAGTKPHKTKSQARELAHDLEKHLNFKAIFPGRNLIDEIRRTVISSLLEQRRELPDFSVLAQYKKLAGSSKGDAAQADFSTPAGRDQELQFESKSSDGSRDSSQGVFPKKRRGRDLFFLPSPIPSLAPTVVRMDEGRQFPGEDVDFFMEPEGFNQQNLGLAAVQPHPRLLSSQYENSTAESSFASDRHRSLQEAWLRTPWPWEQGPRDTLREPRSRQESARVAYRPLQKKSAPQRHYLPFSTSDSWSLAHVSTDDRHSSRFPEIDSLQHSYFNELRSEQWSFQEEEPASAHSLHLSQHHWDSQALDMGLRSTETAASESQTSFDVLRSIWSPNVPSGGTRCPAPQAPGYPFLAPQPSSSRDLSSGHEDLLQLYGVSPDRNCRSRRQNPLQEMQASGRHPLNRNQVFSGPAKPRSQRRRTDLEPERISNSYRLWGPSEPSLRTTRGTTEKGGPSSSMQACFRERLSQMEGLQHLRLYQQLPMSYFPPSEDLENKRSPLHTSQGHLLGQASPEPWAFPRMKLY